MKIYNIFNRTLFIKVFPKLVVFLVVLPLWVCSDNSQKGKNSNNDYGSTGENQGSQGNDLLQITAEEREVNSQYELVVYKSPTCGCCTDWVEAMEGLGYRLTVHSSDEQLMKIKQTLNFDPQLQSCHTTLVEGYILEGHVHPQSVARLLKEREKIRGLFLPGMVPNSVGMEQPGAHPVRYSIVAIDLEGKKKIYDVYN